MIVLKVLLSNFFIIITREMSNFIMKGQTSHKVMHPEIITVLWF